MRSMQKVLTCTSAISPHESTECLAACIASIKYGIQSNVKDAQVSSVACMVLLSAGATSCATVNKGSSEVLRAVLLLQRSC